MAKRRCAGCGQHFVPRAQVPHQRYCSAPACQQARRRHWLEQKRHTDPDYRANQAQAQRQWAERNRHYWRDYRQRHPEYTARNRQQQRDRDQRRLPASLSAAETDLAKSNVSTAKNALPSGRYRLIPVTSGDLAKNNAWMVEIEVLSDS